MNRVLLAISFLLLLCPSPVFAAEASLAEAMIRHDVDTAHLTLFGLTPGVSTMDMVTSALGVGQREKIGSGERAYERLCYVSAKGGDFTKVIFESPFKSTSETTGSVVTTIKVYAGDVRYKGANKCISSTLVDSGIRTESGIGLKFTEAQLAKRLGAPTETRAGYAGYEYHALKNLSKSEVHRLKKEWPFVLKYPYLDIHSSIEARFYNGALKRLDLSRIVSRP